jgi:uncharacterized membrane protein YdbT with pleckstrin-like domain
MSLLNPTPEELRERQAQRLGELAERAERQRLRRRRFILCAAMTGGALFIAACWAGSFGGHLGGLMVLLAGITGSLFAGVIAAAGLGTFQGMLVYGLGCNGVWMLGLVCGWWRLIQTADIAAGFGPVLVFVSCFMGLVVAGALFGVVSDSFDDDTLQM